MQQLLFPKNATPCVPLILAYRVLMFLYLSIGKLPNRF